MSKKEKHNIKSEFHHQLNEFAKILAEYVSDKENKWTIKGFIDIFENIYTISSDTKIVSKVLEIHLFPKFLEFAEKHNYKIELATHQNWYPDISFISKENDDIKFAVDLKTTYRLEEKSEFCNRFTLGSHGKYFIERTSTKNIQFPYGEYLGHYCLGIIYSRSALGNLDRTQIYTLKDLQKISSVINDFIFFACEKWTIASDKGGSGNTANIGSIQKIEDILKGNGVFKRLGEKWFDDYWMNFGKISIRGKKGETKKITSLKEFVKYRGGNGKLINHKSSSKKKK